MYFTYLWQSSGFTHQDAYDRFSSVLLNQCQLYKKAFGQGPTLKIKQIENVLIGQVRYDTGVRGWESWIDMGETGIAWGGVCEDFLGKKLDSEAIGDIIKTLRDNPKELLSWSGTFSVITWHGNKVSLTTAATENPTLWHTEGPHGWASGPRAVPLLELVGRRPEPDMGALRLYLSFGYFMGGCSPFGQVSRVRDRMQIIVEQDMKPRFVTYATLSEYLEPGKQSTDWKENVAIAADRLIQRVSNQMAHSSRPVILLTGGRDSRSIAAAARKSGHPFITATSGSPDSQDVLIAAKVAQVLNVEHRLDGEGINPVLLAASVERLKLWAQISEGLLPLNFCLHLKDFLTSDLSIPVSREQFGHGLEPGIGRGSYYPDVEIKDLKIMGLEKAHTFMTTRSSFLKSSSEADSLLKDIQLHLDHALDEVNGNVYHWFELLLWRERGLKWGMDLQSVYSPVRWAWTPLFDRELLRLSWDLTVEQKKSGHFLKDVYTTMMPGLVDVGCTQYFGMRRQKLVDRIKLRAMFELGRYLKPHATRPGATTGDNKAAILMEFWETALLNGHTRFWKEFIEEKKLRQLILRSPQSEWLWRLLTIDFVAEEHFGGINKQWGNG